VVELERCKLQGNRVQSLAFMGAIAHRFNIMKSACVDGNVDRCDCPKKPAHATSATTSNLDCA